MEFANEREIQDALIEFLLSEGHNVEDEVTCDGGRVDILTDDYIIECKQN